METSQATVEAAWEFAFRPDRGAPAKLTMESLASWSEKADSGVKYLSGTGTYTKTLQAPAEWFQPGDRLRLSLGGVKNLAEVTVNGKPLGGFPKSGGRLKDVHDAALLSGGVAAAALGLMGQVLAVRTAAM